MLAVSIGIASYFGIMGNDIAWKERGYNSIEQLRKGERGWNVAGIMLGVMISLLIIVFIVF